MNIKAIAPKYKDYILDLRRHFHKYPEASLQEFETSKKIRSELDKLDIPYKISTSTGTGILATIKGGKNGKTIALRSDIDALPITECNFIDYKSKNSGYMHACGHDGHMASLLGAARMLKEIQAELSGTVKLIFQPGEETGNGAKALVTEGFLDGVDSVFGIHLVPDIDCGKISIEGGPRMASSDKFKITVNGKSGHGAKPNLAIDALVVASAIVLNIQSIVSREVDPLEPLVVSVGTFKAGTQYNIIADTAVLEGTTRCFNNEIREKIPHALRRIIQSTAKSYKAEAELEYDFTVPPVVNDYTLALLGRHAVEEILSTDAIAEKMKFLISEDFAEYLQEVPGVFALVGARNPDKDAIYSLHNGRFNIDEDSLQIASTLYAEYAYRYLEKSK